MIVHLVNNIQLLKNALSVAGSDVRLIITDPKTDLSKLAAYDWSSLSGAVLEDIVDPQRAQACAALDCISAEDWVREVILATRVISWG